MSLTLLVLSVTRKDGFAILATVLLSLLSSLIGLGSRWSLKLMKRNQSRHLPEDDIVIKYPNGAFLIVKCDENTARELYWHPEECEYRFGNTTYRLVSLLGTITLMFGVICLGNSTLELQIAFAAAYMILNAAYWAVAALPPQWHWDLTCYSVLREDYGKEVHASFTLALWKAIAVTRSVSWVRHGQIAPVSDAWKRWVDKAEDVVARQIERDEAEGRIAGKDWKMPEWDADEALTDFLNPDEKGRNV